MSGRASEHVPAQPFVDWLNQRLGQIAARNHGDIKGSLLELAAECGWGEQKDGGLRKLYRTRKSLGSSSRMVDNGNGAVCHKKDLATDKFPRPLVEEALFHAGVPFGELYPEIAAEEEVVLEPDVWCPGCRDQVVPINGYCPWCDWRTGPPTGQRLMGRRTA